MEVHRTQGNNHDRSLAQRFGKPSQSWARGASAGNDEELATGMVKDPVCGMSVDPQTSTHRADYQGQTYYFCRAGCREKFVADPERYLAPAEAPAEAVPEGTIYTCPMHPEIRQVGPGSCPICGMALEPELVTAEAGPESRTRRHDAALLDRLGAGAAGLRCWKWADIWRASHLSSARSSPTGCSSCSRRRSCCGPAGRSSCAAGSRSSRAISTCSR